MKFAPVLAATFLTIFAVGCRLLPVALDMPSMLNFSPLMAIAFCGSLYLPRLAAWSVPLVALFLSDLFLNQHYGVHLLSWWMAASYGCYAMAIYFGSILRRDRLPLLIGAGVIANSLLFYLVTNSLAWVADPLYPKNLTGWIQALTIGLPGYPPTWTFFVRSLVSDSLYTLVFILCMRCCQSSESSKSRQLLNGYVNG